MGNRRFYEKYGSDYEEYPAGETFTGDISGEPGKTRNIRVFGEIIGNISLPEGVLHIADGGMLSGDVSASCIIVEGSCEGSLQAEIIELGDTARVQGSLNTGHLAIAEGSFFNGDIHTETSVKKTGFKERRKPQK